MTHFLRTHRLVNVLRFSLFPLNRKWWWTQYWQVVAVTSLLYDRRSVDRLCTWGRVQRNTKCGMMMVTCSTYEKRMRKEHVKTIAIVLKAASTASEACTTLCASISGYLEKNVVREGWRFRGKLQRARYTRRVKSPRVSYYLGDNLMYALDELHNVFRIQRIVFLQIVAKLLQLHLDVWKTSLDRFHNL